MITIVHSQQEVPPDFLPSPGSPGFRFFFQNGGKSFPNLLIKEKFSKFTETANTLQGTRYKNYSSGIKSHKRFASANTQSLACLLIFSKTT
jgi:hypothetical protein